MANESEKELAGRAAAELVRDGDIVGLGTGSTAYFTVLALGKRVKAGLKIVGIPTSNATAELARAVGIPLSTLDQHSMLDIDIDGADEIDPQLNLIKGGGGALLREKVIAAASKKMVVIGDSGKMVPALGKFPLPVEIVSFARAVVERKIASLGATTTLRTHPDGSPYLTDNGNPILDCSFGKIADPPALARVLRDIPGVVEHGLFIGLAKLALIGQASAVKEIRKERSGQRRAQSKQVRAKRPRQKRSTDRRKP
jgi:ribose 5-phosphate isomerase A